MSCEAVEADSKGRRGEATRHAGHRCKHDLKRKRKKHVIIKETIIVERCALLWQITIYDFQIMATELTLNISTKLQG